MKNLVLLVLFALSFSAAHAQFQCDLGGSYSSSAIKSQSFMRPYTILGTNIKDTSYYLYDVQAGGFGVYVYPKYHIVQAADLTVSIGAPLMFGLAGSANSQNGSTQSFLYDLNVCLDINGGRLNRRQDYPDKPLGFFAGVGFGLLNTKGIKYSGGIDNSINQNTKDITFVPENGYFDEYMTAKSAGLLLHAGVVAPFLKKQSKKSIGMRFFVKPGLGKNQLTYYGLSAFLSFSSDRGY